MKRVFSLDPAPVTGRFVILAAPRTGSTFLVDWLDRQAGVKCLSEIFHPNLVFLRNYHPRQQLLTDLNYRDQNAEKFLNDLMNELADTNSVGFKLFWNHNNYLLNALADRPDWKKVLLWRENLLEVFVSAALARKWFGSNEWGRVPDHLTIEVDTDSLIPFFHWMESQFLAIENVLHSCHAKYVTLEYQQLSDDARLKKVLRYLTGGPSRRALPGVHPIHSPLEFRRGPGLNERIRNIAEVTDYLSRTRYRKWARI